MASYSNVYRRLVAATRRLRELLKGLLHVPLLIMRCNWLNRNLRSIDSIGYVHTAYSLILYVHQCAAIYAIFMSTNQYFTVRHA